MALDLRKAIGWLLLALGAQLVGYGLTHDGAGAALDVNWGSGMIGAGLLFQLASRRKAAK